ncbi:MAG: hypothetical protein LBV47_00770 [Bacteroidales bacterium]|jgi:hypothetical protein|nr:hypothetical protein [Bacteroidales bacterium]
MKKTKIILSTIMLFILIMGCEKQNKEPEESIEIVGIVPVKASNEVSVFFEENVRTISNIILAEYNYDWQTFKDSCVIINSAEELPAFIDGTPVRYPTIDFDAYTLVIGQWVGGYSKYLMSQSLVAENEKEATINLIIGYKKETDVDYPEVVIPMCFWGFYPKFEAESLYINVTYKN